ATRSARNGPEIVAITAFDSTMVPSATVGSNFNSEANAAATIPAAGSPAMTPPERATKAALPVAAAGMTDSDVRSPAGPRSSAKASSTSRRQANATSGGKGGMNVVYQRETWLSDTRRESVFSAEGVAHFPHPDAQPFPGVAHARYADRAT